MKKIMIVIEENGQDNGKGFSFYMEGDTEGLATMPEDDMSPAQFYGLKLFEVCRDSLREAGVIKSDQTSSKH